MTGKKKALQRFVVKWDFLKSRSDEMDLDKGDVVLVSAKFHDGWYKGIRLRGYKVGYFPGEYVEEDSLVESNGTVDIPKEQITEVFSISGSHHSNSTPENGQEPKELDLDSKRTKAAEEILSTEVSYCNGLDLIVEHFIQPLRIYGVLSVEEIDLIFSNIESLAGISKELVSKLENRLTEWDVKKTEIGDVLLEMFNYLKMFKPYFDSRSAANRLRIQYEKSNDRFKTFLSRVNCGHTLDSLLLMPIQRIPRYELLLKELVKRTSIDHPDYNNLFEALAKAQETASELNEHIRQIENEAKIFEIIKMFPNDELNLIISHETNHSIPSPRLKTKIGNSPSFPRKSKPTLEVVNQVRRSRSLTDIEKASIDSDLQHAPSDPSINRVHRNTSDPKSHIFRTRMFIHEGPVQKVIFKNNNMTGLDSLGEQSDRYLILFSDIAIVAVEAGNLITSNKFKLKERIDLTQCWVADKAESFLKKQVPPETFVLGTPKRTYVFLAPTAKGSSTWQKLLWKRISVEKQKFFQFWRNRQVPDKILIKTTVYSKVQYLSMNDCELDIEFNEEISVIGFRKGGLWTPGFYDADEISNSFISDWIPAVNSMGKFGWIPAECVPGINTIDNKDKCIDQFSFVSVATALHIKQKMLKLTQSQTPLKFLTSVKVYRADGTFRTCKLNEATTTEDIINHLDKHNRLCGLNIEKECIELWEESKDGSVKRKHKPNDKILETISFWGEYQSQLSFVAHTRGMKECVESLIDPAIEVTIERRQSRGSSTGRLKRLTGEDQRQHQSVLKTTSDSNMNVKL